MRASIRFGLLWLVVDVVVCSTSARGGAHGGMALVLLSGLGDGIGLPPRRARAPDCLLRTHMRAATWMMERWFLNGLALALAAAAGRTSPGTTGWRQLVDFSLHSLPD